MSVTKQKLSIRSMVELVVRTIIVTAIWRLVYHSLDFPDSIHKIS
jgi:hypothetical protein